MVPQSRIGRSHIWRRGSTEVTVCHGGSACGRPRLCTRFERLRLPQGRGSQVPDRGSKRLRLLGSAQPVPANGEEEAKKEYEREDTSATHSPRGHHFATLFVCRRVPWAWWRRGRCWWRWWVEDRLLVKVALEPEGCAIAIVTAVAGSASADLGCPRVSRFKERKVGALLALLSATTLCKAGARGHVHAYREQGLSRSSLPESLRIGSCHLHPWSRARCSRHLRLSRTQTSSFLESIAPVHSKYRKTAWSAER